MAFPIPGQTLSAGDPANFADHQVSMITVSSTHI